jgi:5-methylcytosine-specific restriction endonuclease McrA
MMKTCAVCGRIIPINQGARCDRHKIPARSGTLSRTSRLVVASATRCALCGEGPRAGDPFVADHRHPRGLGGSDELSNLQPAHRSCNGRKGARLGHEERLYPGG